MSIYSNWDLTVIDTMELNRSLDAFRQKASSASSSGPMDSIRSFFGGSNASSGSAQYAPLLGVHVQQPNVDAGPSPSRSGFSGFVDRIKPASMYKQPREDGILGTLSWTQVYLIVAC